MFTNMLNIEQFSAKQQTNIHTKANG